MIDLEAEQNQKTIAYLVGKTDAPPSPDAVELAELRGLVDTLGMEISGQIVLKKPEPQAKFGIGTGKAAEIADAAEAAGADVIIFDYELSPTHQRNWEKLSGKPCFDRHEVILRIFADRAQTKEAVLQVELAKLGYSLPRLAHTYGDMSRQRGGSYGSKGAGETKLELDRRAVQDKMLKIRRELEKVVKERETPRKKRDKVPLPSCALVGYTNAGKSSLLNALTGADAFVENKLFATLDPTTRRLSVQGLPGILLTDTVGFISNLPHSLVDAFKSTLEEAVRADLLLLVLDATDPAVFFQYETVIKVLKEIGADKNPVLILLNKMDAVTDDILLANLRQQFPGAVEVSAKCGGTPESGFDALIQRIANTLLGEETEYHLPLNRNDLVEMARKNGVLITSEWRDEDILVVARCTGQTRALLEQYRAL